MRHNGCVSNQINTAAVCLLLVKGILRGAKNFFSSFGCSGASSTREEEEETEDEEEEEDGGVVLKAVASAGSVMGN